MSENFDNLKYGMIRDMMRELMNDVRKTGNDHFIVPVLLELLTEETENLLPMKHLELDGEISPEFIKNHRSIVFDQVISCIEDSRKEDAEKKEHTMLMKGAIVQTTIKHLKSKGMWEEGMRFLPIQVSPEKLDEITKDKKNEVIIDTTIDIQKMNSSEPELDLDSALLKETLGKFMKKDSSNGGNTDAKDEDSGTGQ